MQHEMAAPEGAEKLAEAVKSKKYDLIVCNFANGDMVGHTGILEAAVKAVETVDSCLGTLKTAVESVGGALLITADHGNSEKMRDPETGAPHTAHTTGEVPLVLVAPEPEMTLKDKGRLADVAPSILDLMGLDVPAEMTGLTRIVRTEE